MSKKGYGLDTIAVRGGYKSEAAFKSTATPIYMTNAYEFNSTAHGEALFQLKEEGDIYSRLSNPTVRVLEERTAELDGGKSAVAFTSGHSAIFSTILNLASAGDEIVSSIHIYGGAVNMLGTTLRRLGINVIFVDPDDLNGWEDAVSDKTRAFFVETVGNPNADVADIEGIAKIAHKYGIPFLVDSTFTTPALIRPLEHGADIVIHSATKFLGGHGTAMGGIVVDGGKFEFKNNPRFPLYNQPDESYHGLIYADLGEQAFSARLRSLVLRDVGGCLSPFNAFLILSGIETLSLRMKRHSENALIAAEFLANHPKVKKVNHPLLPTSPYFELAKKYLPGGAGGVFTFELEGGRETGGRFIDSLEFIIHCANVGDTRSLVVHPATTTHSQLSEKQLIQAGISPGTVRLSIGLESIEDIILDLKQALDKL